MSRFIFRLKRSIKRIIKVKQEIKPTCSLGISKIASWRFGSNFSPSGLTFLRPCFSNVFNKTALVIVIPSCTPLSSSVCCKLSGLTAVIASSKISATSNKSLQKPCTANILVSSTCFWPLRRTFSVSAKARWYLS